jgi:hypothetical protein
MTTIVRAVSPWYRASHRACTCRPRASQRQSIRGGQCPKQDNSATGGGFAPFLFGAVSISVILAPLFNTSGGSILLAMLFHSQLNNPLWPDAQPHDTVVFAAVAALVTAVHRKSMFSRTGATRVIPMSTT